MVNQHIHPSLSLWCCRDTWCWWGSPLVGDSTPLKKNQAVSQKGPKPTYHYKWSDRVPRLGAAYWGLVRCLVTGVVHANTPSGCSYFLSASQYTSSCNLYFGTTEDLWLKSVFSSVRLLYNIKFVTQYGLTWWGFHSRLDDVVTLQNLIFVQ